MCKKVAVGSSDCVCCVCVSAVFEEPEDPSTRSFFSEIIASISDVKFSHSGRYILSRDYLTVKVFVQHSTVKIYVLLMYVH